LYHVSPGRRCPLLKASELTESRRDGIGSGSFSGGALVSVQA
jgi:hypothetical protein